MAELKRQRIVIVRECLWKLTDEDFYAAAVLGQMLYWSVRTRDVDVFLKEEHERMHQTGESPNVDLTRGWVYKSADELANELLEICSRRTVNRRLKKLVDLGLLDRRRNPKYDWDRTWQYRPDFSAIDNALRAIGYTLSDALPSQDWALVRESQCIGHSDQSSGHSDQSKGHSDQSNGQADQAIPETTAEITKQSLQAEPAAGSSSSVQCTIHNTPMQLRHKDGDQWYSHKLPDGSWCKGAPGDQPWHKEKKQRDPRLYITGEYADLIQT